MNVCRAVIGAAARVRGGEALLRADCRFLLLDWPVSVSGPATLEGGSPARAGELIGR